MAKKLNVKEMLESAVLDNLDTEKETKELKEQRNSEMGDIKEVDSDDETNYGEEQMCDTNFDRNTGETKSSGQNLALDYLSERQLKTVKGFVSLMETKHYTDKKEQFILRLSKYCFSDYEELTRTYNYKMGEKATRNDIMRKVLEHFHTHYIPELIENLNQI